ncbi:MAG: AAA family ATPase [Lachnospiraceae bacterium]|jgi:predicted AAA+ superfamily ATPase|nr:AAA family ATPase [Lachnospiraceae bacterium]
MLKRTVDDELIKWAESDSGKCLMLRGARQVGKTFSSEQLGKSKFESVVSVNFLEQPELKSVFTGNLDTNSLIMNFSVYLPSARFVPEKTLIILDEIQECPEAVTSLKFWAKDNRFKVIATGSMLGIDFKRPISYPVGSVEYINMHPLSFREFLYAAGINDDVIGVLEQCCNEYRKVPDAINERMMNLLRQYLVVGGMPEAVSAYFENNSLIEADKVLRRILNDYRYDIAHYASPDIKIKAEKCYFSLADQLSKENHKFQYGLIEKGGNARKFGSSLDWLNNADLTRTSYNLTSLEIPFSSHFDSNNFRLYPTDIGLLVSMYEYMIKGALLDPSDKVLAGNTKGGLYEALIADMLIKSGHDLYYRKNEQATFEIEFLLERPEGIIPVEVKAGHSRSRSLDNLLKKESIPYGYKLIDGNVGKDGKKITLPLYMAMFL